MPDPVQPHSTHIEFIQAPPPKVNARADMTLQVKLVCAEGCDLRGAAVSIRAADGAVVHGAELTDFDGTANATAPFTVQAPLEPRDYTWTAEYAEQEKQGVSHEASSVAFSFVVKPHTTSMTIWDVPSPVGFHTSFRVKVGVKCSAGCALTGQQVHVYDRAGALLGTGILGDAPWANSGALYWTEVELQAPATQELHRWTVKFPAPQMELAHEGSTDSFAFTTTTPPEYVVTVQVSDKSTQAPLNYALVTLLSSGAPYRGRTDPAGAAKLHVPKGEYKLCVSMPDYMDWQTTTEVTSDVLVSAELVFAPDDFG